MKKIILFLGLALSFQSWSKTLYQCWTPTTITSLQIKGDYLYASVSHPYGAQFTPIFKGAVSSLQVNDLLKASELQRSLGNKQTIRYSLEDCTIKSAQLVSCRHGEVITPSSGFPMRPLHLETSLSKVSSALGQYEVYHFRLVFLEGQNLRYITSDFSPARHCHSAGPLLSF